MAGARRIIILEHIHTYVGWKQQNAEVNVREESRRWGGHLTSVEDKWTRCAEYDTKMLCNMA